MLVLVFNQSLYVKDIENSILWLISIIFSNLMLYRNHHCHKSIKKLIMKLVILSLLQLPLFKHSALIVIQWRNTQSFARWQFNISDTNSRRRDLSSAIVEMMRRKLMGQLFQKKSTRKRLLFVLAQIYSTKAAD